MKMRPCKRLYIVLILSIVLLSMIPLGVTAQEDDPLDWKIYQVTQTEITYANITTIWIQHPMNGSLVSSNQKLTFIVVPFDADEYLYNIKVYKNDIHMYTCNREEVYVLNIYTDNAINDIVTVTVTLNDKEVLKLTYYAVLLVSSVSEDVTEAYLKYLAERGNQSLSGRELITMRDKAMSDINLIGITGGLCILFTTVAGLIVIIFKLISMLNAFTGIVMFISGFFWVDSVRRIDNAMRSISYVTATDVTVYWSTLVALTMIFCFALVSYVIGYKIGLSRLTRWKFLGQDINNRKVTEYETVIHKKKGKYYWWTQTSWDAVKQAWSEKFRRALHFSHGDITDTFQLVRAKNVPEHNDDHKVIRAMKNLMNRTLSNMAFVTEPKDNPINPKPAYTKRKLNKLSKPKLTEIAKSVNAPINGTRKELVERILDQQKQNIQKQKATHAIQTQLNKSMKNIDRKYNFEVWKYNQDGILSPDVPIIWLNGDPEPVDLMTKEELENIEKGLDTIRKKTEKAVKESDATEMEEAQKRFKLFQRNKPKPYARIMNINLSNATSYDTLHFTAEADYLPRLSRKYADKDRECHRLQMEQEVRTSEKAMERIKERDRQLEELRERHRRPTQ